MYKNCKKCGNDFWQYKTVDICPCRRKPINKESKKRKKQKPVYDVLRIEVLSEAKFKCFIEGCTNVATTCEHRMGRKGYADDWARENDIPLYIDKRFMAACCSFHNTELENNTELSLKYQLSKIHGREKIDKRK